MIRPIARAIAVACALAAWPAAATTVLEAPIEELARQSPVVVRGVVESQRVEWSPDHLKILTYTTVRVTRAIKGAPGAAVTVRQIVGQLDGLVMGAAGEAKFVPGEEVLLFLEPHPKEAGAHVLAAMAAAKFVIHDTPQGKVAERNLEGLAFVRRTPTGVQPSIALPASTYPLDTFLRAVETGARLAR